MSKRRILRSLVSLHDREDRPVGASRLADDLDADPDEVRDGLETLRSYELVKRPPGAAGYVPTVTGRELLDLDLDDGEFVVIEVPDGEPDHEPEES